MSLTASKPAAPTPSLSLAAPSSTAGEGDGWGDGNDDDLFEPMETHAAPPPRMPSVPSDKQRAAASLFAGVSSSGPAASGVVGVQKKNNMGVAPPAADAFAGMGSLAPAPKPVDDIFAALDIGVPPPTTTNSKPKPMKLGAQKLSHD